MPQIDLPELSTVQRTMRRPLVPQTGLFEDEVRLIVVRAQQVQWRPASDPMFGLLVCGRSSSFAHRPTA
jgi:hypothetical protein